MLSDAIKKNKQVKYKSYCDDLASQNEGSQNMNLQKHISTIMNTIFFRNDTCECLAASELSMAGDFR